VDDRCSHTSSESSVSPREHDLEALQASVAERASMRHSNRARRSIVSYTSSADRSRSSGIEELKTNGMDSGPARSNREMLSELLQSSTASTAASTRRPRAESRAIDQHLGVLPSSTSR